MAIISTKTDEIQKQPKSGGKKEMSLERVRLVYEKLQLGRVKITITFIALGFTSYKYFYSRTENGGKPLVDFPNGRHIGLFLIVLGFVMLLLSTIQHYKSIAELKAKYPAMKYSLSLVMSYFILMLSITLSIIVILRA